MEFRYCLGEGLSGRFLVDLGVGGRVGGLSLSPIAQGVEMLFFYLGRSSLGGQRRRCH